MQICSAISDSLVVFLWEINTQEMYILLTGSMIWLDTSNVSYSNWYKDQPSPYSSTCGYILKNAKYQWGVTENCSQEFDFICEFGKMELRSELTVFTTVHKLSCFFQSG